MRPGLGMAFLSFLPLVWSAGESRMTINTSLFPGSLLEFATGVAEMFWEGHAESTNFILVSPLVIGEEPIGVSKTVWLGGDESMELILMP